MLATRDTKCRQIGAPDGMVACPISSICVSEFSLQHSVMCEKNKIHPVQCGELGQVWESTWQMSETKTTPKHIVEPIAKYTPRNTKHTNSCACTCRLETEKCFSDWYTNQNASYDDCMSTLRECLAVCTQRMPKSGQSPIERISQNRTVPPSKY